MSHYVKFNLAQQGISFLAVLIFMQIMAMFSMYMIELVLIENRMTHDFHQQHLLLAMAENSLQIAEKMDSSNCLIPVTPLDSLLSEPLNWWRSHVSCAGNFQQFQYYYVTEFLGNDACAYVSPGNTADYFRITLLAIDSQVDKLFLQTTFVKPNPSTVTCSGTTHVVQAGRQSWKEAN